MLEFLATVLPVLIFLLAIALVAEICDRVGVFDVAGHALLRLSGGRVLPLWIGLVLLCLVTTSVLSLDTTAVLVAPVAIAMAKRARLDPVPFAVTAVWLANTGSLLLPVSNLTNLLSSAMHGSPLQGQFTASTWLPALTASVVTVIAVAVFWPRVLKGRFRMPAAPKPRDPFMLWLAGGVCVALAVLFGLGVEPAWPTVAAAVVLTVAYAKRGRSWRKLRVPWVMALVVLALFVVVRVLGPLGLDAWLASLLGDGHGFTEQLRVAFVGALGSNLVNNLPAFLALQPGVDDGTGRAVSLLIGANAGSIVTPWGSLATLLWLWRCKASGVKIALGPHVLRSGVLAAAVLPASVGALQLLQLS